VEAARNRRRLVGTPSRDRLREVALAPPLILLAICALVTLGAGLIALHVTAFTLDESLIEQSAVHYTSNLPHSLLHDVDARATDRLYSLVLSIAFHFLAAANAIRVDHLLSVVLFVSAAAPIYLLSTSMLRSRLAAVAVAALSVVVPWLAITSALFTENLSYPLFWWMMLAVARAIASPSRSRDATALIAIGLLIVTRVQFVAVFVGYVLALSFACMWRTSATSTLRHRIATAARELVRRGTFTVTTVIVVLAVLAYERATGQWTRHVETLLGSYSNVVVHKAVPPNMVEGIGVELIALALGVGLLPAIVSIAWYFKSIGSPAREGRRVMLIGLGILLAAFMMLTVFAQLGYLGAMTEERYFFYVTPVFWFGAFAALEDRNVRAGEIALCALALGLLYGTIPFVTPPFGQEIAFLAPVEAISTHVFSEHAAAVGLGSLTMQDALAALAVLAGALTAWIWRAQPALRGWWIAALPVSIQLLFTSYAYATINGDLPGIPGRTAGSVGALGWVDAHAGSGHVWWLDNLTLDAPPVYAATSEGEQRVALFWNSHLTNWAAVPAADLPVPTWPLAALPNQPGLSVEASSGRLTPVSAAGQIREVVAATNSAFLQLAGTDVAHSPDGVLALIKLSRPVRATWLASGLQPDGYVTANAPVRLHAFLPARLEPQVVHIELDFAPLPAATASAHTSMLLHIGSLRRRIVVGAAAPSRISVSACVPPARSSISGTLVGVRTVPVGGEAISGMLDAVEVSAAGMRCSS
jgi:hypothetical protein